MKRRPIGLHIMATRIKVPSRPHSFRSQYIDQVVAADASDFLINLDDNILIIAAFLFVELEQTNSRDIFQLPLILIVILTVLRREPVQVLQRG